MHIDVTTTNKRTGKLNQAKYFSLRGEGKEEAGWRELEQLLPQIGQAGPTLAGKLLLPGRMVEHNVRSDINVAQSISLGTSDYSIVVHIAALGEKLNEVVFSERDAVFAGVFEKVKLYSMLEPAMALPPELLHMNGVESSMSDADWAAIVRENPAIESRHAGDFQIGRLSQSAESQLGIVAPPPPTTSPITSKGQSLDPSPPLALDDLDDLEELPDPGSCDKLLLSAESCDKLLRQSPELSSTLSFSSIKEVGRQATRKVPLAAAARQRATPSLGKNTWPIENQSERLLAARCQRDERFLTRAQEPNYAAITDEFNMQAGIVDSTIRPKTIKDVRDFYTKMLLSASAATFATTMTTTHIDVTARVKQQICMKCKRPKEPGHYIRAYEKVDGHWKPRANVCRYFDGEEAYAAAAKAKRAREVEAAAKKVAAKKAKKEARKNT